MTTDDELRERLTLLITRTTGCGARQALDTLTVADAELLGTLTALERQYTAYHDLAAAAAKSDAALRAGADVEPIKAPLPPSPSFAERVLDALTEFGLRHEADTQQSPDVVGIDVG